MLKRVFRLFVVTCFSLAAATVPAPKDVLGFTPGDDYKLADYAGIVTYFQKVASVSDRVKLVEFGKSSEGRAMYLAMISDPENLKQIERYKEISRRLALGQANADEARNLSHEGKAIVWIDSGLHASEVAPVQHSPGLLYKMVTDESPETQRIRRNVILLQIPVINPDGLDNIVHWYRTNVGTPYEQAPLPWLYQKYSGHDNNRDWYMMNLPETRNVTRLLYSEWFPQIVYNQHQAPAFPARIFVPPYAEPLNPNIPAPVMEGINLIGSVMKERFAMENKPGILSYYGFDAWWNGGLRSVPAFHNMHGILTEVAGYGYATPKDYKLTELPEYFPNGMPTKAPSVFYERPWMGGRWSVRNAIDYMMTADFAILDLASARSSEFLLKAWSMATSNIEAGGKTKPFAYVIPIEQWDRSSVREMAWRLQLGGIELKRARASFKAGARTYSEGSYVILAAQAFRGYLADLLEPQNYPDLRSGATGPAKRPYDIAGWTLSMQMGVSVDRIDQSFSADLENAVEIPLSTSSADHREDASFTTTADILARGDRIRWAKDGKILKSSDAGFASAAWELKRPRVALYGSWTANIDAGWTQWVLDTFHVPFTVINNRDVQQGSLKARFDTIILPDQTMASILHGIRDGELPAGRGGRGEMAALQRPEYTGGIEVTGLAALEQFVRDGGTLIAFDAASELPVQLFPLPVRAAEGFYCPGSILRITVDATNPIAFGMPKEAYAFSSGGQAWDVTLLPQFNTGDREVKAVAKYAAHDVLASGWFSGEPAVLGKDILVDARHGRGHVVLFGFRPQFRGQPYGTFKFLLNAIYLGSASAL
jgi:hypothetical protein